MSELTSAAETMAAEAEPAPPTVEEAKALAESGQAEGTTPEEVAKVLKGSGMKIATPAPAAKVDDGEEGTDPDTPVSPEEATTDDEVADEEPAAAVEPAKPTAPPAADETDDKYSLEVTDLNGVTFKIPVGATMEDILAEFEPKNNGQVLDILRQLQKLETQKAADEAEAATQAEADARTKRANSIKAGWDAEAKVLQGDKRIPEGKDGTARVNEVYKFMADENTKRMDRGRPTLNSFEDALDKLENKEARDKAIADAKAEKERVRSNGALVGGSSAAASSGAPVYRSGSAKNANQAIRALGLL